MSRLHDKVIVTTFYFLCHKRKFRRSKILKEEEKQNNFIPFRSRFDRERLIFNEFVGYNVSDLSPS